MAKRSEKASGIIMNILEYDRMADTVFSPIYDVIAEHIVQKAGISEGVLVDIGCGGGHLGLTLLQKTSIRGYLVDVDEHAVEIAGKRATQWNLSDRAKTMVQDVHNMQFPDGFADLVVSRGSFGFWKTPEIAFSEIWRILAPGGTAYVGGGLGNRQTQAVIREKLNVLDPEWPASMKRKMQTLSTPAYREIFENLHAAYEIIENEDSGRWFILRKTST